MEAPLTLERAAPLTVALLDDRSPKRKLKDEQNPEESGADNGRAVSRAPAVLASTCFLPLLQAPPPAPPSLSVPPPRWNMASPANLFESHSGGE